MSDLIDGDFFKSLERCPHPQIGVPSPICLRLDGKAFHTFTKGLSLPFDVGLSNLMIDTTEFLMRKVNAVLGYTQSDEITLIVYPDKTGQLPFAGRREKISSIYAGYCSAYFNISMAAYLPDKFLLSREMPVFDCRTFAVAEPYLARLVKWRQDDCSRNSVSMLAQSHYPHNELQSLSTYELKQKLITEKGVDWRECPDQFKFGTLFTAVDTSRKFTADELDELPMKHQAHSNPELLVTRREIKRSHPNLHRIINLEGFLFNNEQPTIKYSCAI